MNLISNVKDLREAGLMRPSAQMHSETLGIVGGEIEDVFLLLSYRGQEFFIEDLQLEITGCLFLSLL